MNPLYWIAFVMALPIIGAFIYLLRITFKERDDPENQTIHENYMPQYSDGHTDGIIDEVIIGKKRIGVRFYPRDLNYIRLKKEGKVIKPYLVWYDKCKLVMFPQGSFSGHRNKSKGFPSEIEGLPEGILNDDFGKAIMLWLTQKLVGMDTSKLKNMQIDNLNKISQEDSGLKIVWRGTQTLLEHIKDMKDVMKKDEPKQFSGTKTT